MQPKETRTILITGCSSGIGYACAHGLRERGYRVFASARKPEDVERLSDEGLETLRLDLDNSATIRDAVDQVLFRTQGQLYALFNNGAYTQVGAVEDLSRTVLRAQLETNLLGWHELTCHLIPVMRNQGYGRIVQNSSVLGLAALAYRGAYVASKFALEGLTDTLRLELVGSGIEVSLIEPGPIESRIRANSYEKFRAHIEREHSPHREQYLSVERRLLQAGPVQPFTLLPQAVLKKLIHALESPRPKPRYYVTIPTYLFGGLRRVLSSRRLDQVLTWTSGAGHR